MGLRRRKKLKPAKATVLVWGESLLLCGAAADDGGLLELKLTCVVWGPVFTGLVASNFFFAFVRDRAMAAGEKLDCKISRRCRL